MKTDRELLELAAKAFWGAEIDDTCSVRWSEIDEAICYMHGDNQDHNGQDIELVWNPFDSNWDVASLEASLGIELLWHDDGVQASRRQDKTAVFCYFHDHGNDKNAARRRASVEHAAAIGEVMP